jgi:signal transduction histidine kinase
VILAARTPLGHRSMSRFVRRLEDLGHRIRRTGGPPTVSTHDALVRALCHDMRTPLASLEAVLHHLDRPTAEPRDRVELLGLARAQTEHLSSMLRTAAATGGAVEPRSVRCRRLGEVVAAAIAISGLPASQLETTLVGDAGDVEVGDARTQRILLNLLENAHRHGSGALVHLRVLRIPGWVELHVTQGGIPAHRIVSHLSARTPPADLTGLGLWSVRRQAAELGGELTWRSDTEGRFTFVVRLPDR